MAKVTIEDISRSTGLSRGTVSRALNDRPDISDRTKRRVLDACAKLNYVRNHAARSLATGRNLSIAALIDDQPSALAFDVLLGALRAAENSSFALQIAELPADAQGAAQRLRTLRVAPIDGVLAITPRAASNAALLEEALGERKLASLWPIDGLACDVYTPDYAEAGRVAARRLADLGAGATLYVHEAEPAALRNGFEDGAAERGLALSLVDIADSSGLPRRLMAADFVVCPSVQSAITVALASAGTGRNLGKDLFLLLLVDEPLAARLDPSLSAIDLGGAEIGRRAVETILSRIDGQRADLPQVTRVAPRFVGRASTAGAAHGKLEPTS